jgi:hypothetical protein
MLDLNNEPDHGLVVTLARVYNMERVAAPIPVGEVVQIAGLGLDDAGTVALWSICWRGAAYWAAPGELRPASFDEVQALECCA